MACLGVPAVADEGGTSRDDWQALAFFQASPSGRLAWACVRGDFRGTKGKQKHKSFFKPLRVPLG